MQTTDVKHDAVRRIGTAKLEHFFYFLLLFFSDEVKLELNL